MHPIILYRTVGYKNSNTHWQTTIPVKNSNLLCAPAQKNQIETTNKNKVTLKPGTKLPLIALYAYNKPVGLDSKAGLDLINILSFYNDQYNILYRFPEPKNSSYFYTKTGTKIPLHFILDEFLRHSKTVAIMTTTYPQPIIIKNNDLLTSLAVELVDQVH